MPAWKYLTNCYAGEDQQQFIGLDWLIKDMINELQSSPQSLRAKEQLTNY
jgi:hypothetical protein